MKKTLSKLTFLFVFVILIGVSINVGAAKADAATYSGACGAEGDNVTWSFDTDTGVLTISGEGDMKNYNSSAHWTERPYEIKKVNIEKGVTSIGDSAFYNCSRLESITIPDSVTSIGTSAFYGCKSLTSVTIPDSVTSIGSSAFLDCSSLTSVTIPDSVTSIGRGAFFECSSLTSITIPDSVTSIGVNAFSYCSSLTSITIPDSVTSIGWGAFGSCDSLNYNIYDNGKYLGNSNNPYLYLADTVSDTITTCNIHSQTKIIGYNAFYNCSSLTSITIPDSVTSIGEEAFQGCRSLESVTIGNGVTSIGEDAFYNCSSLTSITIPDSVTSIGTSAFYGCSSLTSITIPDSVTSIGTSAFYGCKSLTSVTIPDSVTSIGGSAFSGCSSLESITLPFVGGSRKTASDTYQYPFGYIFGTSSYTGSTATTQYYYGSSIYSTTSNTYYIPSSLKNVTITGGNILRGAFYNCGNIETINIPDSVTSIGDRAFYYCSSLTSITIPDSVTSIGSSAFLDCSSLTSVTIPDGVTSIGSYAFEYCYRLTSITIPDSVTSIGSYAFSGCSSLTSVTIPDGVTGIGSYAFSGCSSLTSVTIPDSVTSIGEDAFYNCSSLKSVTIGNGVTSIGKGAFSGCSSLESITLPFVGGSRKTASDTYQYPFGYIFGTSSYTGGRATTQYYYGSSIYSKTSSTYYIPSSLKEVTITGGNILYGAFYNCGNIETINIPDSVTSIGDYAFYGCDSLESITIPDSVTSIGEDAFSYCSSLTSITIPDSVTSIGSSAFWGCSSLKSVHISDIAAWCKIDFSYSSSNPLYYAKNLYLNGELVTELVIPEGVTIIGDYAFSGCSSLTSITIPDSVTSIGSHAFDCCSSLTSITIPDSVTSIGSYAFDNCYKLIEVINHSSLNITAGSTNNGLVGYYAQMIHSGESKIQNIDDFIFFDTEKRVYLLGYIGDKTDIVLPDIDKNYKIYKYAFENCDGLTSVTIPDGVTSIGSYAFRYCRSLTSITIPDSVTSISDYAFPYCTSLTSIAVSSGNSVYHSSGNCLIDTENKKLVLGCQTSVIPNDGSVTSIGDYAFDYCSSLTSITIPDGVTSIGYFAFRRCSSLTSITIPDSVTSIGNYAFSYCYNINLYVYKNSVAHKYAKNNYINYSLLSGECGDNLIWRFDKVTKELTITGTGDMYDYTRSSMPWYQFKNAITAVYLDTGVTSVGAYAFYNFGDIAITMNGVTGVGKNAFKGTNVPAGACGAGLSWKFDASTGILYIGGTGAMYDYTRSSMPWYSIKDAVKSVEIADGVTHVGAYAFYGFANLESVSLGNATIGKNAFKGTKAPMGTCGENVTWAFDAATGKLTIAGEGEMADYTRSSMPWYSIKDAITSVEIADGVTYVGAYAFYNFANLAEANYAEGTELGNKAFFGTAIVEA